MFSFLLKFMSMKQSFRLGLAIPIGNLEWNTRISKMHPVIYPKLSGMDICPSIISVIGTRTLPGSGCQGGSTAKSLHTLWIQFAIKLLSSLWWMKVKPPWWQIITWSRLNEAPQTQWLGTLVNSHSYPNRYTSWISFYANVCLAPEWGEQSAKVMSFLL